MSNIRRGASRHRRQTLRRRYPDAPRPYRCWGYPWVPILHSILPVLVLANMFMYQQLEAAVGVAFMVVGMVVYFVIEKRRLGKEE